MTSKIRLTSNEDADGNLTSIDVKSSYDVKVRKASIIANKCVLSFSCSPSICCILLTLRNNPITYIDVDGKVLKILSFEVIDFIEAETPLLRSNIYRIR